MTISTRYSEGHLPGSWCPQPLPILHTQLNSPFLVYLFSRPLSSSWEWAQDWSCYESEPPDQAFSFWFWDYSTYRWAHFVVQYIYVFSKQLDQHCDSQLACILHRRHSTSSVQASECIYQGMIGSSNLWLLLVYITYLGKLKSLLLTRRKPHTLPNSRTLFHIHAGTVYL